MNLTPDQELVFQVLAAVAWADERLNPEEIRLLLDQLVSDFAPADPTAQDQLWSELYDRLFAYYDLEALLQQPPPCHQREWILRLAYLLIQAGQTSPETAIVPAEKQAYRRLVEWLDLPPETVTQIEQMAQADVARHQGNPLTALRTHLQRLLHRT